MVLEDTAKQSFGYVVVTSSLWWVRVGGNCDERKKKQKTML